MTDEQAKIWRIPGQADAARQPAPDLPQTPVLTLPSVDPGAAQRAFAPLAVQVQAFVEALRPAAERMMDGFAAAMQAFATVANSPAMRELAEARRQQMRQMKVEYARRRSARGRRR